MSSSFHLWDFLSSTRKVVNSCHFFRTSWKEHVLAEVALWGGNNLAPAPLAAAVGAGIRFKENINNVKTSEVNYNSVIVYLNTAYFIWTTI